MKQLNIDDEQNSWYSFLADKQLTRNNNIGIVNFKYVRANTITEAYTRDNNDVIWYSDTEISIPINLNNDEVYIYDVTAKSFKTVKVSALATTVHFVPLAIRTTLIHAHRSYLITFIDTASTNETKAVIVNFPIQHNIPIKNLHIQNNTDPVNHGDDLQLKLYSVRNQSTPFNISTTPMSNLYTNTSDTNYTLQNYNTSFYRTDGFIHMQPLITANTHITNYINHIGTIATNTVCHTNQIGTRFCNFAVSQTYNSSFKTAIPSTQIIVTNINKNDTIADLNNTTAGYHNKNLWRYVHASVTSGNARIINVKETENIITPIVDNIY